MPVAVADDRGVDLIEAAVIEQPGPGVRDEILRRDAVDAVVQPDALLVHVAALARLGEAAGYGR